MVCCFFLKGDRMWNFAVSLFLVKMAKDSQLRLSATYGLVSSLAVILLGAVIGRYIDRIPRFKGLPIIAIHY